jgi:hypothetical protein
MAIQREIDRRAIFFIEDHKVTRQMLYSEFDAVLDHYASMPDYADCDMKAVYVVLNEQIQITALVFFQIYFDEEGLADSSWNVPLSKLASISGRGPDLGGGPIKLACRGQCPINWHQKELWDPSMNPGANDLLAVKRTVQENRLQFPKEESVVDESIGIVGQEDIVPILTEGELGNEEDIPLLQNESDQKRRAGDPAKRLKLARMIKDQRLRIRTLASHQEQKIKKMAREHWVEIQSYKTQFESLRQSIEQYRVVNEQLKKKLFKRNEQFLELQDRLAEKLAQLNVAEKGLEQIQSGSIEAGSVEQLKAEVSVLKEALAKREEDLSYRDEREEQLRDELQEMKKSSPAAAETGILSRLKQLDVVFVAYHPGAGHVTIPFSDIKRYSDNPRAFVAAKCFVTEEQYAQWLNHYENPVCRHTSEKGELCGQSIKSVAVPSEFEPGVSDRCKLHDGSLF